MATSPALIAAASSSLGIPETAVAVALRRLRERGLVPVGGRGPYAVGMTPRDATRLLLALCGSTPSATDSAVEGFAAFDAIELARHGEIAVEAGTAPTGAVSAWRPDRFATFGGAVEGMIRSAAEGHVPTALTLRFHRPVPVATIDVRWDAGPWLLAVYGAPVGPDGRGYRALVRDRGLGGRAIVTEVGEETIRALADATACHDMKAGRRPGRDRTSGAARARPSTHVADGARHV